MSNRALSTSTKKPLRKEWWFWFLLPVFAFLVATCNTKKEPAVTEENAKIGDEITFKDSKWKVISAKNLGKKAKSNNMFQKDATTNGSFITVKFRILNTTNKEDQIFDQPILVDNSGREFKILDNQAFFIPKDCQTLSLASLPAGIEKIFWAVYEVPGDAKGLKFQARALASFGDKKLVELNF